MFKRFVLLVCVVMLLLSTGSAERPPGGEAAHIVYAETLDKACAWIMGYPIAPQWRTELTSQLPQLRHLWSTKGKRIIESAYVLTGNQVRREQPVLLTLCNLPSSSFLGPIVNMRHALRSFSAHPVPLDYKMAVVVHEELHALVTQSDLSKSRLLALHQRETFEVRRHLHVMALMKAAFIANKEQPLLARVEAIDSLLPGGDYARAWQLVNTTETSYLDYVDELRIGFGGKAADRL